MSVYILDTDTSSFIMKKQPAVIAQLWRHRADEVYITLFTYAELRFGALKKNSRKLLSQIQEFERFIPFVDFTRAAADEYAKIRDELESKGTPIGNMDMLIAAVAESLDAVLVTNNGKHFRNITGLKIENWCTEEAPHA